MTTGKTIVLIRRAFVGKVMSLLFNMLSRLCIAFLLRRKCLLISWLQSPSAQILEPTHLSEWPSSKSLQTINAGEGVEKREHSCTVGGNVN